MKLKKSQKMNIQYLNVDYEIILRKVKRQQVFKLNGGFSS